MGGTRKAPPPMQGKKPGARLAGNRYTWEYDWVYEGDINLWLVFYHLTNLEYFDRKINISWITQLSLV